MKGKERKIKFVAIALALGVVMNLWACKREAALEQRGLIAQKADAQALKAVFASAPLVKDVAQFDHRQKDHQQTQCSECHQRDRQSVAPKYPYHDACAKCHAAESYLKTDGSGPFCSVCHEPEKTGLKTFPGKLAEFGLIGFSHRLHLDPNRLSEQGETIRCESCHQFDGRKIIADFPNHPECYSCHAHAADQKLGECRSCHADSSVALKYQKELGSPSKLYNFKHSNHLKQPSIGANCERCHQMAETQAGIVRSDIARISTPTGLKHQSACWRCHVQAKEPVCSKCHLGGVTLK